MPIPAGTFQMGSSTGEADRGVDERQHQVTISRPFYLQTTEVTQGRWEKVMGSKHSSFERCGENCPVKGVSWLRQEFIKKLCQMENTDKYRLPTEAEWEWACRAQSTSRFCFGDEETKLERLCLVRQVFERQFSSGRAIKPQCLGPVHCAAMFRSGAWIGMGSIRAGSVTDPQGPNGGQTVCFGAVPMATVQGACVGLSRPHRS